MCEDRKGRGKTHSEEWPAKRCASKQEQRRVRKHRECAGSTEEAATLRSCSLHTLHRLPSPAHLAGAAWPPQPWPLQTPPGAAPLLQLRALPPGWPAPWLSCCCCRRRRPPWPLPLPPPCACAQRRERSCWGRPAPPPRPSSPAPPALRGHRRRVRCSSSDCCWLSQLWHLSRTLHSAHPLLNLKAPHA